MTRMDQPAGFGGGPRIIKPQANVYTVLLLVAALLLALAAAVEIWRMTQIKNPPPAPAVKITAISPASVMAPTWPQA